MLLALISIIIGIVMLVYGGNWTIDGAANLSKKLGIPTLLIGFTVVAFGTSLPELFVSVKANLNDLPGISLGNVFGSNIANVLLVIGAAASISFIHMDRKKNMADTAVMILATGFMMILLTFGIINFIAGLLMVGALIGYVIVQYFRQRKQDLEEDPLDEVNEIDSSAKAIGFLLLGLVFVSFGADILVYGARVIAGYWHVPEAVIGLTIVAFGTSLPELVTAIAAARKNQQDLIVGNIVGSNVFNILFILGVTALIKPLPTRGLVTLGDMIFLALVTFIFSFQLLRTKGISRMTGVLMFASYIIYSVLQYVLKMN